MYADYGVELSRGFRALKVWMSLKTHGLERYVRLIEQNVAQVLKVVDRAYLLEVGRIQASGSAAELAASDEVRKAYMGL